MPCYGENTLSNLAFFIKFGYIPLLNGSPVVVAQDFVTLPIPPFSRPQCDLESTRLSKLDQLRWKELARNGLGKARLVEPIPYFQRPFYLTGDMKAIRHLRQTGFQDDIENAQVNRLEQFVITMLANQKQLKKLDEGKTPPPPTLDWWEPGVYIIQIVGHYLGEIYQHLVVDDHYSMSDSPANLGKSSPRSGAGAGPHVAARNRFSLWTLCHR